jgi:hypothetical protein
VSPYWVLPVYVELIRAVWAETMGTGHYYFDEMRSLVQNQLFARKKNQYLQNKLSKSQQPHQQQCRKREREIKSPCNFGSLKHYENMH